MTLGLIAAQARQAGLFVMGSCHPADPAHGQTLVLLGTDRGFWTTFTASQPYRDGVLDPIDTWSKQVIGDIAMQIGARTSYPSDGPPYAPFIAWALATGRFFQSPTGMMIHDEAGLMISLRGALHLTERLPLTTPDATSPCDDCADRPCTTQCPVDALSATETYDVPTCKTYLETPAGQDCMQMGCRVRRACPVSQHFDRPAAQSAFHMIAFKG